MSITRLLNPFTEKGPMHTNGTQTILYSFDIAIWLMPGNACLC